MAETILVVDDNQAVCQALALTLELHGYQAVTCLGPDEALETLSVREIDLVIQDMNFTQDTTSGEEGRRLFYDIRSRHPNMPLILMTAWTDLNTAVELVKTGHADYMGKPWDDTKLLTSLANLLSLHRLSRQNSTLVRQQYDRQQSIRGADLCGLVFASGAMERCVDLAIQVARSDVSVLITGPNGAGKDRLADIIHANSPLKHQPMIKVNVGALPVDLLEAELFGAEAGAFTGATRARIGRFEAADGGTLFLDEIGNLPLSGQIKLLRVLQTGEFERLGSHLTRKVQVRVISATNANLTQDIADGRFREDLFYRLNVIELALPALAERQDDIPALVSHFTGPDYAVTPSAKAALLAHTWPGNVRELENACKRAVLLAKSARLEASDFGLTGEAVNADSLGKTVNTPEELSREEIETALITHNGVVSHVAKSLGLSRQALYRRMDKLGIAR